MNQQVMQELVQMGFTLEQALDAVQNVNSDNMNAYVEYIFNKGNESSNVIQKEESKTTVAPQQYKMVLVVRNDLGMGKGKIAAQCCHAAVGLYRNAMLYSNNSTWKNNIVNWEETAEAKICLKVESEQELVTLYEKSKQQGLNAYLVIDAGRTQIEPNSKTVLGIGPAPVEEIDKVTGRLRLL
ncbi:hypothetical protein ABK040_008490 [Willaertia magna]